MFSSKVIKTDNKEKLAIKTFYLQELFDVDRIAESRYPGARKKPGDMKGSAQEPEARLVQEFEKVQAQAQNQANSILEAAQRKAQQLEKEGFQKGFAEGKRSGTEAAEQQLSHVVAAFEKHVHEIENVKKSFYEQHQTVLTDLALKVAKKVIHQELKVHNDVVLGIMKSAISTAIDREKLKIRVNPADMDQCIKSKPDIIKQIDGIKQIVFSPDESITRGGVIVEYAFGEIDARIEQQFEEIERELTAQRPDVEMID